MHTSSHLANSSASSGWSQYVLLLRCMALISASSRLYLGASCWLGLHNIANLRPGGVAHSSRRRMADREWHSLGHTGGARLAGPADVALQVV